jgi:hypothetical protein
MKVIQTSLQRQLGHPLLALRDGIVRSNGAFWVT